MKLVEDEKRNGEVRSRTVGIVDWGQLLGNSIEDMLVELSKSLMQTAISIAPFHSSQTYFRPSPNHITKFCSKIRWSLIKH